MLVIVGQVVVPDSVPKILGQITEKTDFLRPVPLLTELCDVDAIAAKAASAGDTAVVVPASTAADCDAGR